MANLWFRMYSEFAVDPKVQMLSEADQRRLTMILCLRCNGNVTLHDDEIAFQLRISNDEWQTSKEIFVSKGFIDSSNKVLNWDKRQFVTDSSAARVSKHRAAKREAVTTSGDHVTKCNVTVTPPDTDTDTDTDTDIITPDGELMEGFLPDEPTPAEPLKKPPRPDSDYFFIGKMGRILKKDTVPWGKSYHTLTPDDALGVLQKCDDYYSITGKPEPKIFFRYSAWLQKEHQQKLRDSQND